ncbi:unnamed protein product [Acanthosepion pharaonis]|uniref:Uncharacterized protein n=1 Tax=Acanthosepion pharaonis TaxID=158019 RepID=A0A812CST0_ACAPH|nr:unnamed protein product [Sepia pharaonis]
MIILCLCSSITLFLYLYILFLIPFNKTKIIYYLICDYPVPLLFSHHFSFSPLSLPVEIHFSLFPIISFAFLGKMVSDCSNLLRYIFFISYHFFCLLGKMVYCRLFKNLFSDSFSLFQFIFFCLLGIKMVYCRLYTDLRFSLFPIIFFCLLGERYPLSRHFVHFFASSGFFRYLSFFYFFCLLGKDGILPTVLNLLRYIFFISYLFFCLLGKDDGILPTVHESSQIHFFISYHFFCLLGKDGILPTVFSSQIHFSLFPIISFCLLGKDGMVYCRLFMNLLRYIFFISYHFFLPSWERWYIHDSQNLLRYIFFISILSFHFFAFLGKMVYCHLFMNLLRYIFFISYHFFCLLWERWEISFDGMVYCRLYIFFISYHFFCLLLVYCRLFMNLLRYIFLSFLLPSYGILPTVRIFSDTFSFPNFFFSWERYISLFLLSFLFILFSWEGKMVYCRLFTNLLRYIFFISYHFFCLLGKDGILPLYIFFISYHFFLPSWERWYGTVISQIHFLFFPIISFSFLGKMVYCRLFESSYFLHFLSFFCLLGKDGILPTVHESSQIHFFISYHFFLPSWERWYMPTVHSSQIHFLFFPISFAFLGKMMVYCRLFMNQLRYIFFISYHFFCLLGKDGILPTVHESSQIHFLYFLSFLFAFLGKDGILPTVHKSSQIHFFISYHFFCLLGKDGILPTVHESSQIHFLYFLSFLFAFLGKMVYCRLFMNLLRYIFFISYHFFLPSWEKMVYCRLYIFFISYHFFCLLGAANHLRYIFFISYHFFCLLGKDDGILPTVHESSDTFSLFPIISFWEKMVYCRLFMNLLRYIFFISYHFFLPSWERWYFFCLLGKRCSLYRSVRIAIVHYSKYGAGGQHMEPVKYSTFDATRPPNWVDMRCTFFLKLSYLVQLGTCVCQLVSLIRPTPLT